MSRQSARHTEKSYLDNQCSARAEPLGKGFELKIRGADPCPGLGRVNDWIGVRREQYTSARLNDSLEGPLLALTTGESRASVGFDRYGQGTLNPQCRPGGVIPPTRTGIQNPVRSHGKGDPRESRGLAQVNR